MDGISMEFRWHFTGVSIGLKHSVWHRGHLFKIFIVWQNVFFFLKICPSYGGFPMHGTYVTTQVYLTLFGTIYLVCFPLPQLHLPPLKCPLNHYIIFRATTQAVSQILDQIKLSCFSRSFSKRSVGPFLYSIEMQLRYPSQPPVTHNSLGRYSKNVRHKNCKTFPYVWLPDYWEGQS